MIVNAPSILFGVSSTTGFFSMVNQFQMFLLLPLLGGFIHERVLHFIKNMEFVSFSFSFIPINKVPILNYIIKIFPDEQESLYLKELGFEYASSIVNNLRAFIIL